MIINIIKFKFEYTLCRHYWQIHLVNTYFSKLKDTVSCDDINNVMIFNEIYMVHFKLLLIYSRENLNKVKRNVRFENYLI